MIIEDNIDENDLLAYASDDVKKTNMPPQTDESSGVPEFEEYVPDMDGAADDPEDAFGIVTTGIEPLEITESGARIKGYIATERRQDVRLGTYVMVTYGDEDLFARIWKLQYLQEFEVDDATEIHSRRMLKSNTTAEVDYKFLALLDPICILYDQKERSECQLVRRTADRIPRPKTHDPACNRQEQDTDRAQYPERSYFFGTPECWWRGC